MTQTQVVYVTR